MIRIIGLGSPYGDDRIGWNAVEAIRASGLLKRLPAGMAEACYCDRPGGGGLLALFEGAHTAILIDAMKSGAPLGTVRRLAASDLEPDSGLVSSHDLSVAETIAIGQALDLLPATLLLYGIEVEGTAPETEIHPDVNAALSTLLDVIALDICKEAYGNLKI